MDVNAMAALYDAEMTALLDRVIPARTITRRPRPSDPWFDAECRAAKRLTRRLKRAAAAAAAAKRWNPSMPLPLPQPTTLGAHSVASTETYGIRSATRSGPTPSPPTSRRHVSCGGQSIYCSVADIRLRAMTSASINSINSSWKRSKESVPLPPAVNHRRSLPHADHHR